MDLVVQEKLLRACSYDKELEDQVATTVSSGTRAARLGHLEHHKEPLGHQSFGLWAALRGIAE